MAEKVHRRGANDEQYWEFNKKVRERDKNMCVICRVLTAGEYRKFMESYPAFTSTIDVAHIKSVGSDPAEYCDMNNALCLCRCHHTRIDDYKNPVTGKRMTASEHEEWWNRAKEFVGIKD